jgi:hypothetical protein
MATIFNVLSVSAPVAIQDDYLGDHDECFLTLGDRNPASGNRYYVSLTGQDAQRDWQVGDLIMVELSFIAFKHQGQWHMSHRSDSLSFVEMDNVNNNCKKIYEKESKEVF